jgi:hypothetical protein
MGVPPQIIGKNAKQGLKFNTEQAVKPTGDVLVHIRQLVQHNGRGQGQHQQS